MNYMKSTKMLLSMLACCSILVFTGCSDDDEAAPALTVQSITATGTDLESGEAVEADLNSATSAEGVPLQPTIVVTFSDDVDASTATPANVTLTADNQPVPVNVAASGRTMTITPQNELSRGTSHTLTLSGNIRGSGGGTLTNTSRTFTTAGRAPVSAPQEASQVAYFNFDGNADDAVGDFNASEVVDITWVADRFGQMESAAQFNGNTSIIEVPNGADLLSQNWTLSYWALVDTVDHLDANGNNAGHFIMGVGAFHGFQVEVPGNADFWKMAGSYSTPDGNTIPNDFFVNGDGQDATNGGWEGIEFEQNVTGGLRTILAQKWAHVVVTYNSEDNTRAVYMNGQLIQRDNLSNANLNFNGLQFSGSDEVGTGLAFGFPFDRTSTMWQTEPWGNYNEPTANHFKGSLDDVRFFSAALTESEVQDLYNSERP
jgi:hypothetical protein